MSKSDETGARTDAVPGRDQGRNTTTGVPGAHVQSVLDAMRKELFSIPMEIEEHVTKPLDSALCQAAKVHDALVARFQAESGAGRTRELARYRASAVSEVGEYLLDTIREIDAGSVVGCVFVDRMQRLRQIVAEAPAETTAPDRTGPRGQRRHTPALRRLREFSLHLVRRLRSWRNTASSDREVSLRQVLQFQMNERLAEDILPAHETVQRFVARRYAAFEHEITEWSFAVLQLDHDFGLEDLVTLRNVGNNPSPEEGDTRAQDRVQAPDFARVTAAVERLIAYDDDQLVDAVGAQFERVLAGAAVDLTAVLQAAGKPILRSARRVLPRSDGPEAAVWKKHRERWTRWHEQVSNRVKLDHSVLVLREELARQAAGILSETRDVALVPLETALAAAADRLNVTRSRLELEFETATNEDTDRLIETLEAARRETTVELQRLFQDSIARDAQTALTDPGSSRWARLTETVAGLPDDLTVHSHGHKQMSAADPRRRPFSIDLREIATNALTPAWPGLLAEAAAPLNAGITRVFVGAENIRNVIDYNLGAAVDELKEPSGRDGDPASSPVDGGTTPAATPIERARKLAADAFRRSVESVEDGRSSLQKAWSEFAQTFDAAVHDDWQDLISQVRTNDMMSERWIGWRTVAMRGVERWLDRGELICKNALALARQKSHALWRLGTRMLRRGRFAVGLVEATEEDDSSIADALRGADDVRKDLPLVYRRLFTIGAVADASLLRGRARDLVSVRRRFEKWESSEGSGTLILTGPIGSGRSSFLEALQAKVFDECEVRSFSLGERLRTGERLVETISEVLALPRDARNWAGIEADLRRRKSAEPPTVFMVDNLEHLLLQTASGTDLLRHLLALMVRTQRAVFWLAAIGHEAWRYFEKVAGMSAASLSCYDLAAIRRKEVEEIVLARHHRSGMILRFNPPKEPSPLLKRRLRRAHTFAREQEILKEAYFDAVFRNAGDSVALTLLYWLRSVEFEEHEDVVAVKPFQPLTFDQLNRLDLLRLFSLKAFVLHNSLTAGELAEVLRIPIERSVLIFEALLRLAVIERSPVDETAAGEPVDCTKDRFRLSRLVVHPVVALLRGGRILY